jgi:hypothetical protein
LSSSIHIVTMKPDGLGGSYLIAKLAWHWARAGHRITVGPIDTLDPALDLAVLHVDRTRVYPGLVPANPAARPFLNGRVLDITKRSFSTARVVRGDDWDGAVIVKSNLNYYGNLEWGGRPHGFLEEKRRALARSHWRLARMLPPSTYPVLPNVSAVPGWVWRDPELIVERFLPEREGDLYCLRGWVFFGARGYTFRLFSTQKVVKVTSIVRHEFLGEPPAELVEFRRLHGWDFGKFDYVEVDGRPVLLDINKTPTISTGPDTPRLHDLAGGLEEFLGKP